MPSLSYRQPGLVLRREGTQGTREQVRDLQRDLRRLGYLRSGLDGMFGEKTELAVKALQYDLLSKMDRDNGAPVDIIEYNKGRVVDFNGICDVHLAECISDILDDQAYPLLPRVADPKAENARIAGEIASLASREAPAPFVTAILTQESGLRHFHEPNVASGDEDTYVTVGLDTNANQQYIITSRGYGAGQYTLDHHPPTGMEVDDFMLDVGKNVSKAFAVLREKFDCFVNGNTSGTRADDRQAEIGSGPLRLCKYEPSDARYLRDCVRCLQAAGTRAIIMETTRLHARTDAVFVQTQGYSEVEAYENVPKREEIGCDWPYAMRRYNGSGVKSYHYQTLVLLFLSKLPELDLPALDD